MSRATNSFESAYDAMLSTTLGERWGESIPGTLYTNSEKWSSEGAPHDIPFVYVNVLSSNLMTDELGNIMASAAPMVLTRIAFSKYRFLRDCNVSHEDIEKHPEGIEGALREYFLRSHDYKVTTPDGLVLPAKDALGRLERTWTDELADQCLSNNGLVRRAMLKGGEDAIYLAAVESREAIIAMARAELAEGKKVITAPAALLLDDDAGDLVNDLDGIGAGAFAIPKSAAPRPKVVEAQVEGWGAWA